ncbi:DUF4376 domain-containing protein [Leisingera methylohalidivorans]|uniref:DUF4376 domain-containing protein n=1 Tax=Leisingera methylohalidivorans DSM 14336 TaxID=999552 RepID=V9W0D2_9RHOB|nr:DUF4376 domain-containing protein [Leisingera methylohalidivorans]AHD03100.1 hypothetical protein METH_11395 [Leisingera methylohalidivorans DSM 14336]
MSNIDFSQVVTPEAKAAMARVALFADLARIRWKAETGGITLQDGTTLPSDEVTARKLTSAVTSLQNGMVSEPVAWKFPGGWQDLTQAQIEAAAAAVAQHVQACFSAERAVHQQIEALSDADLAGFDVPAVFDAALAAPAAET